MGQTHKQDDTCYLFLLALLKLRSRPRGDYKNVVWNQKTWNDNPLYVCVCLCVGAGLWPCLEETVKPASTKTPPTLSFPSPSPSPMKASKTSTRWRQSLTFPLFNSFFSALDARKLFFKTSYIKLTLRGFTTTPQQWFLHKSSRL